jgi:uncharacterized protein (DUF1778 family)
MPSDRKVSEKADDRDIVSVGFPPAAGRMVRRAAAKRHKKVSAFIRDAAIEAAERVQSGAVMVPVVARAAEPVRAEAVA